MNADNIGGRETVRKTDYDGRQAVVEGTGGRQIAILVVEDICKAYKKQAVVEDRVERQMVMEGRQRLNI